VRCQHSGDEGAILVLEDDIPVSDATCIPGQKTLKLMTSFEVNYISINNLLLSFLSIVYD